MYRLVLYYLTWLFLVALILCFFGFLPFNPLLLLLSALIIVAVCFIANTIFSKVFSVQTNIESVYITAFILILLITPPKSFVDMAYFSLAIWASLWSVSAKYILALNKKHLFNPAAIALVITAFFLGQSATWWVGTLAMLPFVLVPGLLIVKKILRWEMVSTFWIVATVGIFISYFLSGQSVSFSLLVTIFSATPILFFAIVMLTEPLTTPPGRLARVLYAAIIGILFIPKLHIGGVYSTPELALVIGNIFSYIVSSKRRYALTLTEKNKLSNDVYDFVFTPDKKVSFTAGQYMEWTLGYDKADARGNRRYFTLASAPEEKNVRLGIKFYDPGSTFKQTLQSLPLGTVIFAGAISGEFVLPKNTQEKLCFLAGGIGITPFRSHVASLLSRGERRDVILLYANNAESEPVYKDIFNSAQEKFGMKTVYTTGRISPETLQKEVPDWKERKFYISGPHGMVKGFEKTLAEMGVPRRQIIVDFFPGFV